MGALDVGGLISPVVSFPVWLLPSLSFWYSPTFWCALFWILW
jgi:hypothetical protein